MGNTPGLLGKKMGMVIIIIDREKQNRSKVGDSTNIFQLFIYPT